MKRAVILILIGLFILPTPALPVPVDPDAPDGVAAYLYFTPYSVVILSTAGEIWSCGPDHPWRRSNSMYDPPIPVAEIQDWSQDAFRATDGTFWVYTSGDWVQLPALPWGPTSAKQQSLGSLKQMFR